MTRSRKARTTPPAAHAVASSPALLSPRLGFVVQFRTGAGLDADAFSGRAEHLPSGRAEQFESAAELVAFLRTVLIDTQAPEAHPPAIHEGGER